MEKCTDWQLIKEVEGSCPFCGHYFNSTETDAEEKGDEVECVDCRSKFLLG